MSKILGQFIEDGTITIDNISASAIEGGASVVVFNPDGLTAQNYLSGIQNWVSPQQPAIWVGFDALVSGPLTKFSVPMKRDSLCTGTIKLLICQDDGSGLPDVASPLATGSAFDVITIPVGANASGAAFMDVSFPAFTFVQGTRYFFVLTGDGTCTRNVYVPMNGGTFVDPGQNLKAGYKWNGAWYDAGGTPGDYWVMNVETADTSGGKLLVSGSTGAYQGFMDPAVLKDGSLSIAKIEGLTGNAGKYLHAATGTGVPEWVTAAAGATGATGAAGATGPAGATGATGPAATIPASSSTNTINCTTSSTFYYSFSTTPTFTFSNMVDGKVILIAATNTSGGALTPVFTMAGGDTLKVSGAAPSVAGSATTIYTFAKIGSNVFMSSITGF
jgi:hypothetical protein